MTRFMNFAPLFSSYADVFVGSLGKILAGLTRFLAAVPGLDIAGLVLTPTSAGDDSEWVRNHPYQRGTHIHVGNITVTGDPADAGRKTFEYLSGLSANPQVTLSKGRTSPTLPTGRSVFAPAR
jgi:hypothetical protein